LTSVDKYLYYMQRRIIDTSNPILN